MMETHTGMDVAWCLTCSKSTGDASNTYCSEACRLADCGPTPSSSKVPLTSPVPALYSSPRLKPDRRRSSVSPTKIRPAFATRATVVPPASEAAFSPPKIPCDRRAFSFPSAPNSPPLLFANREHRGSTTLPPFARRDIMATLTPTLGAVNENGLKFKQVLAKRLAKSTGANTPGTAPESVFLSTSESSDDEEPLPPKLAPRAISGPVQFSTLRNQLSIGRTNSLQSRSTSTSPVAAMVASSASSRSREDIISWAKAIDRRNTEDEDVRGRPRAARISSLARLPPPSTELLDEHEEELENEKAGTTPKGRIGSALAGLSGYGMGSIVKALASVTASPSRPAVRKTAGPTLNFPVAPSPAEVAKVDVVASTMPLDDDMVGTATLSTVSFSEVVDPSVFGTHDHVEIATDDMSSASGFHSRRHRTSRKDSIASVPPPVPARQSRSTLWSLSSYLTRFAPFSISSVISPYTSRPPNPTNPSSSSTVPTVISSATATPEDEASAPVPALRSRPDTPESPAQQLVRSIPMDIAMPPNPFSQGTDFHVQPVERLRSSRSRARSRSGRRSRSRSLSAGRLLNLPEVYDKGVGMSNQDADADADVSDEEGVADRGRERRERGRGRDAAEDRERGRGRGRDRSVKAI